MTSRFLSSLCAAMLAIGACAKDDTPIRFDDPSQFGDCESVPVAGQPLRVFGTRTHHTVQGSGNSPIELSTERLRALAPVGDDCTTEYRVTGKDETSAIIAGVPSGLVYLDVSESSQVARYLVTSDRDIDLGYDLLGRSDVRAAPAGTRLLLNVSGLRPWKSNDQLQIVSINAGLVVFEVEADATNEPRENDTAMVRVIDWHDERVSMPNLIDASLGDRTLINHLVTRNAANGESYASIDRTHEASFSMVAGGETEITAALTSANVERTIRPNWRRSAFAALRSSLPLSAEFVSHELFVAALPSLEAGIYDASPDLVLLSSTRENEDFNSDLVYRDPFGEPLGRFAFGEVVFGVDIALPGSRARTFLLSQATGEIVEENGNVELAPRIAPPRDLRINGLSASVHRFGVGLKPKLSWTAPEFGEASIYEVFVHELFIEGEQTRSRYVGKLTLRETEVSIPDGLLRTGATYVFRVAVRSIDGWDLRAPKRFKMPDTFAENITALVAP